MNDLVYDGSNYLLWRSKVENHVLSIDENLWSIIVDGFDFRILGKKKFELSSLEVEILSQDLKAFQIIFKCLNEKFQAFVVENEATNANHLWKLIFDDYVDEMEFQENQRRHMKTSKDCSSTQCLIGHMEEQKEGSISIRHNDCASLDDMPNLDDDDLLDEDNDDDMPKEQLIEYVQLLILKLGKSSKENRGLRKKVDTLELELSRKSIVLSETKCICEHDSLIKKVDELEKMNESLSRENEELIKKGEFYEQLQRNYDEMKERVSDLSNSLEKLTHGKENLERLLGSQRIGMNKKGLGFDNYMTHSHASTTTFVKESNSLDSHTKRVNHAWKYINNVI